MNPVIDAYAAGGELGRMIRESNRLEWERTCELLQRWLPAAPARVLDVGGGPGEYAMWLCGLGYQVQLVDVVPLHVQTARGNGIDADVGDARSLAQGNVSVDAVLLLGPLYHLPDGQDRAHVLHEARRVLVPGGVLVAAGMSRWARTLVMAADGGLGDPRWHRHTMTMMRDGHVPDGEGLWDRCTFRHDPGGLTDEVRAAGFADVEVLGVEGPAGAWARRDPSLHAHALELAREAEYAMAACSIHLLARGFKD